MTVAIMDAEVESAVDEGGRAVRERDRVDRPRVMLATLDVVEKSVESSSVRRGGAVDELLETDVGASGVVVSAAGLISS